MKTTFALSAAALVAFTAPVFAGAHTQGLEAQRMGKYLKANPGSANIASTLKPGSTFGAGGWGNLGSALLDSEGNFTLEDQGELDDGVVAPMKGKKK